MQINLHVQLSDTYTNTQTNTYVHSYIYAQKKKNIFLCMPAAHFIDAHARRCIFSAHANARWRLQTAFAHAFGYFEPNLF